MTKPDITSLLDDAYKPPRYGPRCFRARLTGEADEFMSALEARVAEGRFPTYTKAAKILQSLLPPDERVSQHAVSYHLRGACSCPKR